LNQFILTAALVAKEALRYTPAGLPVIECQLEHSGEVQEAGNARQVKMSISAIAIGSVYEKLNQMHLGKVARFSGFLTHKSLRSQRLVFHITHIEL
jgi:primosomal replication protein N